MKKVRISEGFIGLVYRKNNFARLLQAGDYWLRASEQLKKYNMSEEYIPAGNINLLLRNTELAEMLHVFEVQDNEITFLFENSFFKRVLQAGRYLFWKEPNTYELKKYNLNNPVVEEGIPQHLLTKREVSQFLRSWKVESYERAILLIDGKFERILESGIYYFWNNNQAISVQKADLRTNQLEISGQEILTRDKINLRINFYIEYSISDVKKALLENQDYEKQLYISMQLVLREYIGAYTLDDLLQNKNTIEEAVFTAVKGKSVSMGVTISNCGIRDVILPGDVKEILNQVLIAEKKAQANIITRREETASTRSLLNTAKLMEENTMLFRLKEMEYVEKIAERINNISISGNAQILDQFRSIFSKPE